MQIIKESEIKTKRRLKEVSNIEKSRNNNNNNDNIDLIRNSFKLEFSNH